MLATVPKYLRWSDDSMADVLVSVDSSTQPTYIIRKCTEQSDPALVAEALRIHAAGYLSMGFLNNGALTEEGFIHSDIDRSRGETTEYYLAYNSALAAYCATLRKVRLRPGASIDEFDCYDLCRGSVSPDAAARLTQVRSSESQPVAEISALARTAEASPGAVWHLLRAAVQDGVARSEFWLFCIVASTYDILARHMGTGFMRVLGGDVTIDDGRVNSDVVLRPVAVDAAALLDAMLVDHERADGRARACIERSLLFFSEGLDDSILSPAVTAFREERGPVELGPLI
jgi:hypothetical protein